MKIDELHQLFLQQKQNFTTDTRKIKEGALFFALKGDRFNANTFAKQALEQGASYVIIDEQEYYINKQTIVVKNVLETLQRLAFYHREHLGIPIVSLTGSNGKTTTKELIREVLATQYNVKATLGNLNNHIGVPLTLLSMTTETEIGIVEMGANHLKEIQLLCFIAAPNYGYITNFGKAHIEGFGSEEGIVQGKSEMYDYLAGADGIAFVNKEDERHVERSEFCTCEYFSPMDTPLIDLTPYVKLAYNDLAIQSNLIGKYNYNNIVAAINIGHYFKVSDENIKKAIENYTPENNRSQIIKKDGVQIILDAYNANPTSMSAALENLEALNTPKKAVILGDMFELGDTSKKEHKELVAKVINNNFDVTIFVGEHFYQQKTEGAFFFKSFNELKESFSFSFNDHTLLIKGSRGMALERTLELI
ncbi:UDP-N-acetylmuramoyl-tripeptide--D-alanyl-D-alanine ligase [Wenyingzhuangia sp. IMCC45574]